MTDNQINSLNMANTAIAFLDKNSIIFNTNANVTTLLTTTKGTVTSINLTATTQSLDNTGATITKQQLRKVAADKAEHVCTALQAYANVINDSNLFALIHFSHTDFTYSTVAEVSIMMQLVHDKAAAITTATSTPLLPFFVTAADITDLQTAINNFTTAAPAKKVLQAASTAATELLNTEFTTLNGQFDKMDILIKTYNVTQPAFVSGYEKARKIINLGKTQKAKELNLMPHHFESIFGKKFKEGDTFTVRNHSAVPVKIYLTDTPKASPSGNGITINPDADIQVSVSEDFGNQFGHWLTVFNPADLDDAHVTVILAHGKSESKAATIGNVAP